MIKERLIQFIDYKGISKYSFYKETGLSNGALDKKGTIGADKCELIYSIYKDINLEWLITGKGEMLNSNNNLKKVEEPQSIYGLKTDIKSQIQQIPLYNIEASAGIVSLFKHQNDEKAIDYITIPDIPKCDGAIYVTGDSMYPLLKSGDIIMYKEKPLERDMMFIWGEMYLISFDLGDEEYVTIKWVQRSEKGDAYIKLASQNQHHQPMDVPKSKLRACAMIKASIRINAMN